LKRIWQVFLLEILVLAFIRFLFRGSQLLVAGAVAAHIIITVYFLQHSSKRIGTLLTLAFLARVLFMLWDVYARHIYLLPNSGADTEMYFFHARRAAHDFSYLFVSNRAGIYSKVIGVLFFSVGAGSRLLGSYVNVLLGISTVMLVQKSMARLDVRPSSQWTVLLIASFFPNSLIMSAIFLREIFPTFFVAASLYFFLRWFQTPRARDLVLTLVMLGLASMFHSGVIGIFLGYAYAFLFYNHGRRGFVFLPQRILSFILLVGVSALAVTTFQEDIFGKFQKVEEFSDIYQTANLRDGGSAYLLGMEINTVGTFLMYAPIKMLYFLASPVPMDWRGPMDIFTFFADSMLYLAVVVSWFRSKRIRGSRRQLEAALAFMLLGAVIIFGIGVSNAGTAVRHRQKLVPIFLIVQSVIWSRQNAVAERLKANPRRHKSLGEIAK